MVDGWRGRYQTSVACSVGFPGNGWRRLKSGFVTAEIPFYRFGPVQNFVSGNYEAA